MSEELRHSLWNVVNLSYGSGDRIYWRQLCRHACIHFFKRPIDLLPSYDHECHKWIREQFYALPWHGVYDLVEFLSAHHDFIIGYRSDPKKLTDRYNYVLESEFSGYRFIDGTLAPISSSVESSAIVEAIEESARFGLDGASAHLKAALQLLSLKPTPDFRNSVKESISAVEAVAKQLGKSDSSGLAGALTELEKAYPIHNALKSAFLKLYGYASDEGGIRHAMLEDSNVGFDEAKYMLVSCSAFVNYLTMRGGRSGARGQAG